MEEPLKTFLSSALATDESIGVGMAPFFYLPHTLFVVERGLGHFDLSMRAQSELTKRFSAEAGVRPYIARDPDRALAFLQSWAADENPHVRAVFLSEGIQKFLFPDQLGAGRFLKIGLPSPEMLGPLVGGFEVLCGALVLMGRLTRVAAIPLLVIMAVAFTTTKWPIFVNQGFWTMAHEARTDWSMTLGALFLLLGGGGPWSADAWFSARRSHGSGRRVD